MALMRILDTKDWGSNSMQTLKNLMEDTVLEKIDIIVTDKLLYVRSGVDWI